MTVICPYCLQPITKRSKDHIFPKFFGGHQTITSCKKCNDTFGRTFEGSVSHELSEFIVSLSRFGYKHPGNKPAVFKRAWKNEETGSEWDIDSDNRATLNKPQILRDEENRIMQIVARSDEEVRRLLKRQPYVWRSDIKRQLYELSPLSSWKARVPVGKEMERLAVKMCVALAQNHDPNALVVDPQCREFLLNDSAVASGVIRRPFHSPELDALCPPLGHLIYVEANSSLNLCYGVVQLFGKFFEFYVPLCKEYTGKDFAIIGTLDVVSFKEIFQEIEPKGVFINNTAQYQSLLSENFKSQIEKAFGTDKIRGIKFD